jgi:hypothetical protein
MSYRYNQNRKAEKLLVRCKNITISEFKSLQPDKFKSHKKIVDFVRENNIALKL